MSLLSVPALIRKKIAVMIIPGQAVLIHIEANYGILGPASHANDGLFYIDDNQGYELFLSLENESSVRTIISMDYEILEHFLHGREAQNRKKGRC